jgi:hypothetical protein
VSRGALGGIVGCISAALLMATISALKNMPEGGGFLLGPALMAVLQPAGIAGWLQFLGVVVFGSTCALLTAAVSAARHGAGLDRAQTGD